jgi:hypothetical protein
MSIEDKKRKIAGLLAKAEGTDNPHERDAFSAKAEKMMLALGIERAELEASGKGSEDIVQETRDWRTIYAPAMGRFAYTIGHGFGDDLSFLQSRLGKDLVRTYVIGHKSDVEDYLTLLNSLDLQVWAAVKEYRRETRDARRYRTIHENFVHDRTFIYGFADTVRLRLQSERREAMETASEGAALVFVGKGARIEEWVEKKYPKRGSGRASRQQTSASARAAGARAGMQASMGSRVEIDL